MTRKLLFAVMLLLSFQLTIVQAQSVSVSVSGYQPGSPFCVNTYIPTIGTIDIVVSGSGTLNSLAIESFYGGIRIGSTTPSPSNSSLPVTIDNQSFARTFVSGQPDIPDNSIVEIRVTASTGSGNSLTSFSLNCTTMAVYGVSASGEDGETWFLPPDNRLNWRYGDSHIGILYPGYDGAIDLYDYESDTYTRDFFTADDIPDSAPDENILIRSLGRTSIYILTTGQIQFNLGPDREGKIWVFIMNDLDDRDNLDSYYIPPPE